MAMKKLCSCGKAIDISIGKCDKCQSLQGERHKLYDKHRRDQESAAFYKSSAWQKLRAAALTRDLGICQHCLSKGTITLADMVDHIIPVKEAWELRLVLDNLQSLCNRCHAIKTAEDKKKYR